MVNENPKIGIVRVELNHMNSGMRRILKDTIAVFRDAHSFLVHVVYDNASDILSMNNRDALRVVERLIHKTKDNPNPEYPEFDKIFYKFPSYIRRAAINSAIGYVSSYKTRCEQYHAERDKEIERGHHFKKMQPGFTFTPKECPTLYKKETFRLLGKSVLIKVRIRNTWDWIEVSMPNRDYKNLVSADVKGTIKNPQLVFKYNKFYLEFPVEYPCREMENVPLSEQTVLAIDRGFNHGAVCSVVNAQGVALKRFFSPFKADENRIDHVINLIRKYAALSGRGQSLSSLYTKLQGLKDNYVKQLSRWIVNIAISENVYGIVLEHLESIKGRGGLKARVHHWTTAKMRDYIMGMAFREGIRTFIINPKGTSMYAFDGSGKIKRDSKNYSLCMFTSGKQYNCDLSASYNIASRYFLRELQKSISVKEWSELKAKVPELAKRTEWTLATLRKVQAA